MDCQFCSIERATHFKVPTIYGVVVGLCRGCYAKYARVRHRPRRKKNRLNRAGVTGPRQLCFPFCEKETGGPAEAARFCDRVPPTQQAKR